ncbi:hypothetical protein SAMN05880574_10553 [Chryseobacterium sp. RU37D]|uniref:hypothetical protein n=1 Tax=Chryseobacterium sp. RU37D TaxID=1907397 RepID=UPI000954D8B3|nr:hypothetical protein [Chryseobacterium sp. RU37D]SIQ08026.1 hypothetical protein SAMN05880574_10553 [Chryseobacterium sp. RU37D]
MKDFDLEKLERKNIYKVPENLFENIQGRVLSGLNNFDLEKLERKNIYTVPENLFENIQENVLSSVLTAKKKVSIFKLNWAYAAAASLALIFGATFIFDSNNDSKGTNSQTAYASNIKEKKSESEKAYETLKSDLTSIENNNQIIENQNNNKVLVQDNSGTETKAETISKALKSVSQQEETQMNEYLDSFTNSEISELASNSTQDVYLDLYN